jgi:hypothetical protein
MDYIVIGTCHSASRHSRRSAPVLTQRPQTCRGISLPRPPFTSWSSPRWAIVAARIPLTPSLTMHWIASSEKDTANTTLEKRLWDAAD